MEVKILGTVYKIRTRKYDEAPDFRDKNCVGFCSALLHEITLCDMHTWPVEDGIDWAKESEEVHIKHRKQVLRHEIVHAFFDESGLQESAAICNGPWATFEEMVDWWAIQGPKVYQAWKEADAL